MSSTSVLLAVCIELALAAGDVQLTAIVIGALLLAVALGDNIGLADTAAGTYPAAEAERVSPTGERFGRDPSD